MFFDMFHVSDVVFLFKNSQSETLTILHYGINLENMIISVPLKQKDLICRKGFSQDFSGTIEMWHIFKCFWPVSDYSCSIIAVLTESIITAFSFCFHVFVINFINLSSKHCHNVSFEWNDEGEFLLI